MATKKKKQQTIPAHVDRLYKAVENYVKNGGGSIAVIGGIQVQGVGAFEYSIAVRCTGQPPKFEKGE